MEQVSYGVGKDAKTYSTKLLLQDKSGRDDKKDTWYVCPEYQVQDTEKTSLHERNFQAL